MPHVSASCCNCSCARATCTPLPATSTGLRDSDRMSMTRCTSDGALSGLAVFRNPAGVVNEWRRLDIHLAADSC